MKTLQPLFLFLFLMLIAGQAICQKVELLGAESCCLYADIANPIKVVVNGKVLKAKDYNVEITGGTFEKTDSCLWVSVKGNKVIVNIENTNGKVIANKAYRKIIPQKSEIVADGKYGGIVFIKKQELVNISGFICPPLFFPVSIQHKINRYNVAITLGNETRSFLCLGSTLSDTVRYYLNKMKQYDKAVFSNFHVDGIIGTSLPITFILSDYNNVLFDYGNLFYDFENRVYDDNGNIVSWEKVSPVPIKQQFYDTLPVIIETDCDYNTVNCCTKVYYRIDGIKTLTYEYQFNQNDTVRVKWYFNAALLADIGYFKNSLFGAFTIYYENGQKRAEGFYLSGKEYKDVQLRVNAVTLKEEEYFFSYILPYRNGKWSYFDENGKVTISRRFKDDKVE